MNLSQYTPLISSSIVNLRSSSNYDGNHTVANIRLFNKNSKCEGWVPSIIDENQFVIAGSDSIKTFVAITLQGRGDQDQWVTEYKISYTLDGKSWTNYRDGDKDYIKGCSDRNTPNTHMFRTPFRARSIKIIPTKWYGTIALRMEVYINDLDSGSSPVSQSDLSSNFIQSGKVIVPADSNLNVDGGMIKSLVVNVRFDKEFTHVPKVVTLLSCLSAQSNYRPPNFSIKVEAKNVTKSTFDCEFTLRGNKSSTLVVEYFAISKQ